MVEVVEDQELGIGKGDGCRVYFDNACGGLHPGIMARLPGLTSRNYGTETIRLDVDFAWAPVVWTGSATRLVSERPLIPVKLAICRQSR